MPDLIVTPTVQSLTVSPTTTAITVDALPALTINQTIPLTYANSALGTNLAVSGTQFTTVLGVTLTAGTWLVWGELELTHSAAFVVSARISDLLATNVVASAEGTLRLGGYSLHVSISGLVTLAATDTMYLMAKGDVNITARATTLVNSLPGCTTIKAVKVAL